MIVSLLLCYHLSLEWNNTVEVKTDSMSNFFHLFLFCFSLIQAGTTTRMATWRNGGRPTPPTSSWSCPSASSISTATFPGTWPMDFTYVPHVLQLSSGHNQTKSSPMSQFASASLSYTSAHWYFTSISFAAPDTISPLFVLFLGFPSPHPSLLRGQFAMVLGWTIFVISHRGSFFCILKTGIWILPLWYVFANLCVFLLLYPPGLVKW